MRLSLQRLLQKRRERERDAYFAKNFRPVSEGLAEDIFIAGYPKSGNSWFQDLVAGLVFGVLPDKTHPKLVNDLIPDVHEDAYYKRYQTPTYFKTHHKPLPHYKNVVYLLRDGRDVMVSYWHHQKALQGKEVDFLKMVQEGEGLYPCRWHEHVTAWMANPHQARMITIKYEDLLSHPARELERFCAFSGIQAEGDYIQMIVDRTSFKKLQERERRLGDANEHWPKEKMFHRRGVAGSFRDEMPEDVLQAFLSEAGKTLESQGYH